MWFGKVGDDHLVDATGRFGIQQLAVNGTVGLERMFKPQQRSDDLARFGSGKTYDTDATPAGRCSDGDNGVVREHHRSAGVSPAVGWASCPPTQTHFQRIRLAF